MKRLRFTILALLATIGFASSAHAIVVDFTNVGANLNMGNIIAGQNGTIDYRRPGAAFHGTSGQLSAQTQLVFNYTFTGPLSNFASEVTSAGYDYMNGLDNYSGYAISSFFTDPLSILSSESSAGFINGSPDVALLFATTNFNTVNNTGSISIINNSLGIASFVNSLTLLFSSNPAIQNLTYNATSLVTPIPAALPMFLVLIGGLFGFRRARRQLAVA